MTSAGGAKPFFSADRRDLLCTLSVSAAKKAILTPFQLLADLLVDYLTEIIRSHTHPTTLCF